MKKFLLTAVVIIFSISPLAYAEEGNIYVKVNAGSGKLPKITKVIQNNGNGSEISEDFKPEKIVFYGLGAGYYFMNNIRGEVVFNNYTRFNYKSKNDDISGKFAVDVSNVLLNGLIDLHEVNNIKLFTGAGLGLTRIGGRYTESIKIGSNELVLYNEKFKVKSALSYALYLGAMVELMPNVKADLTYSFRDLGKIQKAKKIFNKTPQFRGHYISIALSFSL